MKKKLTVSKIIVVLICAFFLLSLGRQFIALNKIKKSMSTQQEELNQLKEKNQKLQAEVESAQSNYEYIEKLARERLGLIKEGEQVIESSEPQQ